VSSERVNVVEAEAVPVAEGRVCTVAKRDGDAPPESWATSRTKSHHRNPGGPTGAVGVVADGGVTRGPTEADTLSRGRESDRPIVPTNPPKETRRGEGRGRPEERPGENGTVRTQSRGTMPVGLARVSEVARRDKRARFTALLHHLDAGMLERAFRRLKRSAAPGVDGETVASYEQDLAENLRALHERVHTGRYRPQPVRRVFIPKADGGQRPLGVPTLEDKIVQSAVAEILSAVYEADFLGFSYGFRPGRGPHQALSALHTAMMTQYVNWVLDADIRSFFDSVDHEWLMRMVAHRIADPRILRLVRGWLEAGVMTGAELQDTDKGVPQGAGISPLLANVLLHYVLDLWVHQWRRRHARGRVVIVRYADDFVMGFQNEADARRLRDELRSRLARFKLALHDGKTRLVEFGKLSTLLREKRGERRPETFAFLGFTHYCARTRDGRFVVKRRTDRKRLSRKLRELGQVMRRRMHAPVAVQHRWLSSVLRGHYAYYGLPSNWHRLAGFRDELRRRWHHVLRRRSQRCLTWDRFNQLLERFPLPAPRLTRPRRALHG
jgi:RNA-directed DNA polymerase